MVNPTVDGRQMVLIAQRRRWRRNLSLLCKEEGVEVEVFLRREFAQQRAGNGIGGNDSGSGSIEAAVLDGRELAEMVISMGMRNNRNGREAGALFGLLLQFHLQREKR